MRIQDDGDSFALWVSADDTYNWANRINNAWPCSTLSGHRFACCFDRTGLVEFTLDGKQFADVDANEFNACVSDLLTGKLPEDHPCYFVAIGQFKGGS
jgi:hypothetical protein